MNEAINILTQVLARTQAEILETKNKLDYHKTELENEEYNLGNYLCRRDELIESIKVLEEAFGGENVSTSED